MKIWGHRVSTRHLHPRELFGLLLDRPSPRRKKTNAQLRFLSEVLGLERFHYGLWAGESRTLEGLAAAQERYAERLAEWIPEGVSSILDVGCGVGTDARDLHDRGFEVEGLAPDPYQQKEFVSRTGLPFHLARFQDFNPTRSYDLVLMSESAQYIWLDGLFGAVERAAPGGYLLLSDYFVVGSGGGPARKSGHFLPELDQHARRADFDLLREEDITDGVVPTLELASTWLDTYIQPTISIFGDSLLGRYPRLGRIVLRQLAGRYDKQRRVMDPETFRSVKRYLIRLYRVP